MGFGETLEKYADTIWMLNDEEQHRLFVALVEYAQDGTIPNEQGNEKYLFSMMQKEIDAEREPIIEEERRKEELSEKRRRSVSKRWEKYHNHIIQNMQNDTNKTQF